MMYIARSQTALWRAVEQQASGTPAIYGGIDFVSMPERFVLPPADDGRADGPFGSQQARMAEKRRRTRTGRSTKGGPIQLVPSS